MTIAPHAAPMTTTTQHDPLNSSASTSNRTPTPSTVSAHPADPDRTAFEQALAARPRNHSAVIRALVQAGANAKEHEPVFRAIQVSSLLTLDTADRTCYPSAMPRELRLEYPGAIYHVLNRGNQRDDIVRDDGDRHRFIATLEEACAKTDRQVHAHFLRRL